MEQSTEWQPPDVLSPAARVILDPGAYAALTPTDGGPREVANRLRSVSPEQLLTGAVRSPGDARAMLAGLWLYHDFLHESHTISQDLHSATGSFWHAIMHRREGDFSNAKYWYARCRHHASFGAIAALARHALAGLPEGRVLQRLVRDEWDPDGFVDVVEAVHHKPDDPLYAAAVALQRAEWRGLFDQCARAATKA